MDMSESEKIVETVPNTEEVDEKLVAETRIKARRKRVALRVQERERQILGYEAQKDSPFLRQLEQSRRHVNKLKADGTETVTNILVAADAREVKRREDLREANRLRREKLESNIKSTTEKLNEIKNKLTKAKTVNNPQKLKEYLRQQKQLCLQISKDKDKIISELQQEVKARKACFVSDREREAKEVNLLIMKMREQISGLRKIYKKELDVIEHSFSEEWTDLLTTNKKEWEQQRKELSDKRREFLLQRRKILDEHESRLDHLRIQSAEDYKNLRIQLETDVECLQLDLQKMKASYKYKQEKQKYNKQMLKKREEENAIAHAERMKKLTRLQGIHRELLRKCIEQSEQSRAKIRSRMKENNRLNQQYKDVHEWKKHFDEVDAKYYKNIWLMKEEECRALASRAVELDRVIHEQVLGLNWSPPTMPFIDHSSPSTHPTTQETSKAKESAIKEMNVSEVKAYFENFANIIPESKLKVWRDLKEGLKKLHTELIKHSKLQTETQQLKQQVSELRMMLHNYQNSEVQQRMPRMQMKKKIYK